MPRWTPEARERQRQLIQHWKPWEHSTGPTSDYGKQVSSQNSPYCSDGWKQVQAIASMLKPINRAARGSREFEVALSQYPKAIAELKRVLRTGN